MYVFCIKYCLNQSSLTQTFQQMRNLYITIIVDFWSSDFGTFRVVAYSWIHIFLSIYVLFMWLRDGVFLSLEWFWITKSVLWNFAWTQVPNSPKDLDLSYKMDLDFWDCFGREKKLCFTTEEIWYFSGLFSMADLSSETDNSHNNIKACHVISQLGCYLSEKIFMSFARRKCALWYLFRHLYRSSL